MKIELNLILFLVKCNHKEHYIIDPDSKQLSLQENNNKNITEKNPFYPFSPYWLKANFLTDDYFQSILFFKKIYLIILFNLLQKKKVYSN